MSSKKTQTNTTELRLRSLDNHENTTNRGDKHKSEVEKNRKKEIEVSKHCQANKFIRYSSFHHNLTLKEILDSNLELLKSEYCNDAADCWSKYEIKRKVGSGGHGSVHEGKRKSDDLKVAVKIIRSEDVSRLGVINNEVVPLEYELMTKAVSRGNPGIIKAFELFNDPNNFFIVMEFPESSICLSDYIRKRGPLSEMEAKIIFLQLVICVKECHNNGVIHRDIKGENILLNPNNGQVKLIDFGSGDRFKSEPFNEIDGTELFFPPEWFLHQKYDGNDIDIWQLGVILYTMMQAVCPFRNIEAIIRCEVEYKNFDKRPSLFCRLLIRSLLRKDPKQRINLCDILRHPWIDRSLLLT